MSNRVTYCPAPTGPRTRKVEHPSKAERSLGPHVVLPPNTAHRFPSGWVVETGPIRSFDPLIDYVHVSQNITLRLPKADFDRQGAPLVHRVLVDHKTQRPYEVEVDLTWRLKDDGMMEGTVKAKSIKRLYDRFYRMELRDGRRHQFKAVRQSYETTA
jgi:hypothetical protein